MSTLVESPVSVNSPDTAVAASQAVERELTTLEARLSALETACVAEESADVVNLADVYTRRAQRAYQWFVTGPLDQQSERIARACRIYNCKPVVLAVRAKIGFVDSRISPVSGISSRLADCLAPLVSLNKQSRELEFAFDLADLAAAKAMVSLVKSGELSNRDAVVKAVNDLLGRETVKKDKKSGKADDKAPAAGESAPPTIAINQGTSPGDCALLALQTIETTRDTMAAAKLFGGLLARKPGYLAEIVRGLADTIKSADAGERETLKASFGILQTAVDSVDVELNGAKPVPAPISPIDTVTALADSIKNTADGADRDALKESFSAILNAVMNAETDLTAAGIQTV